ncbi:MAG: hypothetical protein IMX00_04050 [Limnochordales bacterium]|nr:hypothetical protein [Limnochordales bacterium]
MYGGEDERVQAWHVTFDRTAAGWQTCTLQVLGPPALATYLALSLPEWSWSAIEPARQLPFRWAIYAVHRSSATSARERLEQLLTFIGGRYLLEAGEAGPLQALVALHPHGEYRGEFRPSPWGAAIMQSKRQEGRVDPELFWEELAQFLATQPLFRTVNALAVVPSGEAAARRGGATAAATPAGAAGRTLLEMLAERLTNRFALTTATVSLAVPQPQKSIADPQDRWLNLEGAVEVTGVRPGSRVLVLDDVLVSGASMRQVAYALRRSGAGTVVGLALTRAYPH